MISKRDKSLRKFKGTYSKAAECLYKKFRNKVVNESRQARKDYYDQYFVKHKDNMKILWTGILSIISMKRSHADSIMSHLVYNGSEINDSKTMANIFNEFFVNIFSKINEKIVRTRKLALDYLHSKTMILFSLYLLLLHLRLWILLAHLKMSKLWGP